MSSVLARPVGWSVMMVIIERRSVRPLRRHGMATVMRIGGGRLAVPRRVYWITP